MLIRKNSLYRFVGRVFDYVDNTICADRFETQKDAKAFAEELMKKDEEVKTVFVEVLDQNCKIWLPVYRIGE